MRDSHIGGLSMEKGDVKPSADLGPYETSGVELLKGIVSGVELLRFQILNTSLI